jgi:hypothetical protein
MSAPSLRQYELDQVQRVTAPRKPHSRISAPWRDTPGECSKLTVWGGFCQEPAFVCDVISSAEKIIYNLRRESGSFGGVMKGGGATGWSGSKNTGEAQPRACFSGAVRPISEMGDATD